MNIKDYGHFVFIVGTKVRFAVIVTADGRVKQFTADEIGAWFS